MLCVCSEQTIKAINYHNRVNYVNNIYLEISS
jgi:hypothetical protein